MKKILLVLICCLLSKFAVAENKLWVKIVSNDVNHVWIKFDETFSGQKVDRKLIKLPAKWLMLDNGKVVEKSPYHTNIFVRAI